jgi:nucleoside-diphosphate-sugar epimerase
VHLKALVTGSAGFAGRHFREALERGGWDTTGIDIADGNDARGFFQADGRRFDLAVHCAAVVGGRTLIDGPPLALAVNLELDAALFRWALRTRPGRVIYLSSPAAYPVALQREPRLLTEDDLDLADPRMPDQLYGWAKLTGELLASRARAEGLAVTVVRPFSGYGEDQDPAYPFAAFARRARNREDPFTVWGDGQQVRDFIHVDDVVRTALAFADLGFDGPVNLGTGRPVSMETLARMFCRARGYSPEFLFRPDAPHGVYYRVADAGLMTKSFHPEVALEEGILRALNTDGRE